MDSSVELLSSMMGGHLDPDAARTVLRRFNGDLQKAATALLEPAIIDLTADDDLSTASTSYNHNPTPDPMPVQLSVRDSNRPIALRPESPTIAYAALVRPLPNLTGRSTENTQVLQALFAIPQVRRVVSQFDDDTHTPTALYALVEIFVNMDLAQLAVLVGYEVLNALLAVPWRAPLDSPGEVSLGECVPGERNTSLTSSTSQISSRE